MNTTITPKKKSKALPPECEKASVERYEKMINKYKENELKEKQRKPTDIDFSLSEFVRDMKTIWDLSNHTSCTTKKCTLKSKEWMNKIALPIKHNKTDSKYDKNQPAIKFEHEKEKEKKRQNTVITEKPLMIEYSKDVKSLDNEMKKNEGSSNEVPEIRIEIDQNENQMKFKQKRNKEELEEEALRKEIFSKCWNCNLEKENLQKCKGCRRARWGRRRYRSGMRSNAVKDKKMV